MKKVFQFVCVAATVAMLATACGGAKKDGDAAAADSTKMETKMDAPADTAKKMDAPADTTKKMEEKK